MLKCIALAGDGLPCKFGRIGLEKPRFHRQKKIHVEKWSISKSILRCCGQRT